MNNTLLWKCFACHAGGNLVALHRELTGDTVAQSLQTLGDRFGVGSDEKSLRRSASIAKTRHISGSRRPHKPQSAKTPENWRERHEELRSHLHGSPALVNALAEEIKVRSETINRLVSTGTSLGWSQAYRRPVYLFQSGAKLRGGPEDTFRFLWLYGTAELPWRAELINKSISQIYLTESESDAIALIDAGLEDDSGKSALAVASPGTWFKPDWAELFRGRLAYVCFDADKAGQEGSKRVIPLLAPFAKTVFTLNWDQLYRGLRHEQ